jgi:Fur family transcriptional regulator, ferric uptake regulator
MRTRRGASRAAETRPAAPPEAEVPGPWRERLRAGKVKATPNRLRVLGRFLASDAPWTLQSLHRALNQGSRCDLSSVYRALSDLREAGFLEEFRLPGKRETFYALLGHGNGRRGAEPAGRAGRHHHHHIVCEDCGRVSHLDVCLPPGLTVKIEGASGFRVTGHNLEFQGLCGDCR